MQQSNVIAQPVGGEFSGAFLWIAKWATAAIVSTWLSIPSGIQVLLWMMFFDYISGMIAACIEGKFCATELARGFAKKILTLLLVAAVHKATDFLHLGFDLAAVAGAGFTFNEFASVVRNCARAGVKVPQPIIAALENAKRLTRKPGK